MLSREDLAVLEERLLRRIIERPPKDVRRFGIRTTSGTSGRPLMTVMEYPERSIRRFSGSERIVFCFGSRSLMLTRAIQVRQHTGAQKALFIGQWIPGADVAHMLRGFDPDTLEGVPSYIVRMIERMGGESFPSVRSISLFGERLTPQSEILVRETFPRAEIAMLYLSTEFGNIGRTCPHLGSLSRYHPDPEVSIRLVGEDESGAGELLVSKTLTEGVHIDEYAIGDIVRMLPGTCACGASRSFEYLGRKGHDYIKIANALVVREEFDRVAARFAKFFKDYRADVSEVSGEGGKGKIVLTVYSPGGKPTDALAREIARDFSKEVFLTPTQTLADLVAAGRFVPLTLAFVATPFPQKLKDIKLRRVY